MPAKYDQTNNYFQNKHAQSAPETSLLIDL